MKKGKNILIFVLINIIAIGIAVILPAIPAHNFLAAYNFELPSNEKVVLENGIPTNSFAANFGIVRKELQTQESLEALGDLMTLVSIERGDTMLVGFTWAFIMFGVIVGLLLITLGIILKYKAKNKIYSKAFIIAGIIVIIAYIFFLSALPIENIQIPL